MGATVRIAGGGFVEREAELTRKRGQPRENVTELVQLRALVTLADGLRQFAELFGEPCHRRRQSAGAVAFAVGVSHQLLEVTEIHVRSVSRYAHRSWRTTPSSTRNGRSLRLPERRSYFSSVTARLPRTGSVKTSRWWTATVIHRSTRSVTC